MDGTDSRQPELESLRRAWAQAPPPPDLRTFLTAEVRSDEGRLRELIHLDALERHRIGEPAGIEHYRLLLADRAPEAIAPGTELARLLIRLELLMAGDAAGSDRIESLRGRLGAEYAGDVSIALRGAAPSMASPLHTHSSDRDEIATLDESAVVAGASLPRGERLGDWIGPYRLLDVIGEGGFGVVYHAQQREPIERHVALKLIKPGMDTRSVLARFESERQTLALLRHDHIAAIYDAGATERGRPYFVMELVRGEPINRYCDRHRLTTQERLELFLPVCRAVHHAHQKGIIHRDLSPDNILVEVRDGKAVPKIIDFGVAKAIDRRMTERTLSIERGVMIGKPEYMSPEQAEMTTLDIDTTADLYSLGVILYELLAGVLPLDRKTLRARAMDEMIAQIRYSERPTPQTRLGSLDAQTLQQIAFFRQIELRSLSKELGGRLQYLPMKALRADRTKRFSSAEAFARDVEHYLADEDFDEAAVERFADKAWRLIRRNKVPYAAAFLVLLSLVAGLTAALLGYAEADRQRGVAQANSDAERTAREVAQREVARAGKAEKEALAQRDIARSRALIATATEEFRDDADMRGMILREGPLHWPDDFSERRAVEAAPGVYRHLITYRGHERAVHDAVWSPDGRRILTESSDGTVRIWHVEGIEDPVVLGQSDGQRRHAAWSPNGAQIAIGSPDGTAQVWNADGSGPTATMRGHSGWISDVAWSPDGLQIVTASDDGTVCVWNADGSAEPGVLRGHEEGYVGATWSPDGRLIASASDDGTVRVWNADGSGTPIVFRGDFAVWSLDSRPLVLAQNDDTVRVCNMDGSDGPVILGGYAGGFNSAALSPDGHRILLGLGDGTVRVCNADGSGEALILRGHEHGVFEANWSPDGRRIASASFDGTVRVWTVDGSADPIAIRGHEGAVFGARWSPDGSRIVTSSSDRTARVWQIDGPCMPIILNGHEGAVWSAAWDRDGRRIATASVDGTIRVWNADGSGEPVIFRGHEGNGVWWPPAWAPDGRRIATVRSDDTVRVWNADGSGEPVILRGHDGVLKSPLWSPDGRRILTISDPNTRGVSTARVWFADGSGKSIILRSDGQQLGGAAWSPDGLRIVLTLENGTVCVYNADGSGEALNLTGHEGWVGSAAWSPDGRRIVTASEDKTARVWSAEGAGEPIVLRGHEDSVVRAEWSPDGRRILTSSDDNTVRVWTAEGSGDPVILRVRGLQPQPLAWSPDGNRVLLRYQGFAVQIWRVDGSAELISLRGHHDFVFDASWSPDGARIATACKDKSVRVWIVDWPTLRAHLWQTIDDVLSPTQRVKYLGESKEEANATYQRQIAELDARLQERRRQTDGG